MPRTTQKDAQLKLLSVRLPPAWHAAIQKQATKMNRNLQGQMIEIVEYYLRESNEIPEKDLLLALKYAPDASPIFHVPAAVPQGGASADIAAPGSRVLVAGEGA